MKKSKQPLVYVPREIGISEAGKSCTIAYFVSKAYLQKVITEYSKEDGSLQAYYFVNFDNIPSLYVDDLSIALQTSIGDNVEVCEIFKDYQSCKDFVNKINENLELDIYDLPISRYDQREVLQETAIKYGTNLEKQLIHDDEKLK